MSNEDKYFVKTLGVTALIAAIIFCVVWAVQIVVDSNSLQERLTDCETSCYPDDAEEESTSCTCLPTVEEK